MNHLVDRLPERMIVQQYNTSSRLRLAHNLFVVESSSVENRFSEPRGILCDVRAARCSTFGAPCTDFQRSTVLCKHYKKSVGCVSKRAIGFIQSRGALTAIIHPESSLKVDIVLMRCWHSLGRGRVVGIPLRCEGF